MMSSPPSRNETYPFIGVRVLDGSTSKYDWTGTLPLSELPFVINPEKGWFATANNRVTPHNSKYDAGSTTVTTTRYARIHEMITEGIESGKKFTPEDMIRMQSDTVDIIARDGVSLLTRIVDKVLAKFEAHLLSED